MKKSILISALLLLVCSFSFAQTVVVDGVGPDNGSSPFATINAAYTAVKADAATPDVINITAAGPFNENLVINTSVTIKGDGVKPIIVAPPTSGGVHSTMDGNAISIGTTTESGGDITVHLENFTLIPEVGNAPARAIRSNNNATGLSTDKMTIEIVDVLITANDGAGQPVTTDGMDLEDLTGATPFGDDAIFVSGFVDLSVEGVICSNIYGTGVGSADGLVFYADEENSNLDIGPGCVFSYMNRCGIQVAADGSVVRMLGTAAEPIKIKGNWADKSYSSPNGALSMYHDCNGNAAYNYQLEYVYFCDNKNACINTWYADDLEGTPGATFKNCIFANNARNAIILGDDLIQDWSFEDCTIVNNGQDMDDVGGDYYTAITISEETTDGSTGNVSFTDCIIAGNGSSVSTDGNNSISVASAAAGVSFSNCGLVVLGSYALSTQFTLGAGVSAPSTTGIVGADPEFVTVECGASTGLMDVASMYYYGKASDGSALTGFGEYVGGIPTAANAGWALYE